MRRIRFALIAVFGFIAIATAQTPYPFTVSDVVIGSRHIKTSYLYASGKWSVAGPDIGPQSTHIHCYEKFGFCEAADAYSSGGKASTNLTTYDIVRWDSRVMIAVDSSPTCVVNTLRVDFVANKVSLSSILKGTQDKACESFTLPPTAFLAGPQ